MVGPPVQVLDKPCFCAVQSRLHERARTIPYIVSTSFPSTHFAALVRHQSSRPAVAPQSQSLCVWVSEIMLQQTRVAAVLDHYARFLRRFPTVKVLAAARESSVLAMWSGLGYYHRARRMHQAAKFIARDRHGKFPRTAEDWSSLPGIGRYTAAAIASISFGEAVAVVDGNVERVLQRLHGQAQGKQAAWQQADILLDRARPGDFNQAMMELGATICTPRAPQCLLCPLNPFCKSRGAEHPQPQAARKRKAIVYALARKNSSVLLVQRPADASLMAGMWELPALAAGVTNGAAPLLQLRHSITDTDYRVAVVRRSARSVSTISQLTRDGSLLSSASACR